jgi:WD40 repeat protein
MPISFQEVMDFHAPANEETYEDLRDSLGMLLPFVGAGLTAPIYGTWGNAIRALGTRIADQRTRDELDVLLKHGEYLEAAQLLEDKRRPLNLTRDLAHYFSYDKLDAGWKSLQGGAIWLLPDLFACPVLTTNFDKAIETVYSERGTRNFEVLDPTKHRLRKLAVRMGNVPCVFKLHGTVAGGMTDYDTLVFTKTQYDWHYAEGGDVCVALTELVGNRGMLFLGCSLQKDKTVDVLRKVAREGAFHYAIVPCKAHEVDDRVGELADMGISAIVYEDGKHDSVRAVLQRLVDDKSMRPIGGVQRKTADETQAEMPGESQAASVTTHETTPDLAPIASVPLNGDASEDAPIAKLVARINARLERQRRGHPSFRLMGDDFARELLPGGIASDSNETIPNSVRCVRLDDGAVMSFRDFFQRSWKADEQTHLFITGQGGVGKTVAMLSFATEPGFLPRNLPTIYIPLHELAHYASERRDCIDAYLAHCFSHEERGAIEKLSHANWEHGPNVILLLDGHNEVPADRRRAVDEGIRAWAERAGTQLVTTSRVTGLFGIANTRRLELQGLVDKDVALYLDGHGIKEPAKADQRSRRLLRTPLMLRIYAGIETFPQDMRRPYLRFEPSDNAGRLVWNYLQRELWRCVENDDGGFSASEYAFALLLALPFVCWRMESAHEFHIDAERLVGYVDEACVRWQHADKPASFALVEKALGSFVSRVDGADLGSSQLAILSEETGLLTWNGNGYSLVHQSIRDTLAAIHLRNVMDAPFDAIPPEFANPLSEYVKDFVADLAGREALFDLWEANRRMRPTNLVATHNLLRVIHKRCSSDLAKLDWSGMDLRGMSLFPFVGKAAWALAKDPAHYERTVLDLECLRPQSHRGVVQSVCFSPDGALIASGSIDGTVRTWDPWTGRLIRTLTIEGKPWVLSVSFSPDGTLLAGGAADGKVYAWDTSADQVVGTPFCKHNGGVRSICFSPDGRFIAGGGHDGMVLLWDARTGRRVSTLQDAHMGMVLSTCFSPDGALLASGSSDGTVRLWDVACGQPVDLPHAKHQGWVWSVCFGSRQETPLLASGSADGTVRLWDVATRSVLQDLVADSMGSVHAVCFSPSGETLAIISGDGATRLWDVRTGVQLGDPLGSIEPVGGPLCFSPDGTLLAVGSADAICLWDASVGQMVGKPLGGYRSSIESIGFSAGGTMLAGSSSDGVVWLWDIQRGCRIRRAFKGHRGRIRSVSFSRAGTLLASGSDDGTVRVWDVETGCRVGEPIRVGGGRVRSVSLNREGNLLATGSEDGMVRLWNLRTGQLVGEPLLGGHGGVRTVCFSPNDALIACSADNEVRLWDVSTRCQAELLRAGYGELLLSTCFSPDGTLLASGSDDGTLRLWDVESGLPTIVCEPTTGSRNRIRCVCFSPDGVLVAAGSDDGAARLWNVATKQQVASRAGHAGWIRSVCFSPDGSILASSSDDGTVRLWSVHDCSAETIEPLFGVDVTGLDLTLAVLDPHDRKVLRQNGVRV